MNKDGDRSVHEELGEMSLIFFHITWEESSQFALICT